MINLYVFITYLFLVILLVGVFCSFVVLVRDTISHWEDEITSPCIFERIAGLISVFLCICVVLILTGLAGWAFIIVAKGVLLFLSTL